MMVDHHFQKSGQPIIGVAGATGRIGRHLGKWLLVQPVHVKELTCDSNSERLPRGLDRVLVDFDDPETLAKAPEATDRLQGASPHQARNEVALIDAAVSASVSHFVKVSPMRPSNPSSCV